MNEENGLGTGEENTEKEEAQESTKDWILAARIDGSESNKRRLQLLAEHAKLKYPHLMGEGSLSDFVRFIINYYYTKEVMKQG